MSFFLSLSLFHFLIVDSGPPGSSPLKNHNIEQMISQFVWKQFSSVQSLSRVRLFTTPWTAAHQASLITTNCRSLLKLMSIKSLMPSNHLILYHPLFLLTSIFPSIRVFPMSQFFTSGGQNIRVSVSASVLPRIFRDDFL